MNFLIAIRDEKDPPVNAPSEYYSYLYRKKMGISFEQMQETPRYVIENDLDIIKLESTYLNKPETKS